MTQEDLRRNNTSLHERIEQVLEMHPELRDGTEAIALSQDLHVEVGADSLKEHVTNWKSGRERSWSVAPS